MDANKFLERAKAIKNMSDVDILFKEVSKDLMVKMETFHFIIGVVKEANTTIKRREDGTEFRVGTIRLASGERLTIFDPLLDLKSLEGNRAFFRVKSANTFRDNVGYNVEPIEEAEVKRFLFGV